MSALGISAIVFACLFGGGLLGMRLRAILPEHQLSDDSKHLLETGLGVIGTIGGLVLGLLVASAFGTYNAQRNSLVQMSADIVVLDRVLAHYGPEAKGARAAIKTTVAIMIGRIWPQNGDGSRMSPATARGEVVYDKILDLKPKNDAQSSMRGQATGLALSIAELRWLMYAQLTTGMSIPLLVALAFWFTITFMGLGIFAKPNALTIAALFLAAVAVSGAVFLLQEMYMPFQGSLQISNAPLKEALANLGR
jgi:Protein of unknown function (DUF4239)